MLPLLQSKYVVQHVALHLLPLLQSKYVVQHVALHCVKAHRRSQWRSPKFNPLQNLHPLNFKDQTAHVTTSWTSTTVPNFIAIALRGTYPQICEILRFCDFFIVLSWLYFFLSQLCPGRTPGWILTVYGLNDASSPKDVPFWGVDVDPLS